MPKRKRNRNRDRLRNMIANKTASFIERRAVQQREQEKSAELVALLHINGMLK